MMDYFNALHEYDLEIRLLRGDLYLTSAFCGHVFTVKILLKNKNTWTHGRKKMWLPDAHLCYQSQHTPLWWCFCMVQPLRQPFRPKCTNRILQMHHQNPVVPPESGVHPQNPVCTYSVDLWSGEYIGISYLQHQLYKTVKYKPTVNTIGHVVLAVWFVPFIYTPRGPFTNMD